MSKKIIIAKILTSFGVDGSVKLESFTEKPKDVFNYSNDLYDKNNKNYKITFIKKYRNNVFISKIDGINDMETAKILNNIELYIDIDLLPTINEKDTYYYEELLGLNVKTVDNKCFGKIVNINNYGAGIIVDIKWDNEKVEESIPFIDDFFKKIDIKDKIVIIERPTYI